MEVPVMLMLGIALVAFVVLWWLLGKIAKGIRIVITSAALIVLVAFTGYLYWDSRDLELNFSTQPKLFAYVEDDNLIAAFTTLTENAEIEEDLTLERLAYANNDLHQIKGDNFKIFIFTKESFRDVKKIDFGNFTLTREEALNVLAADRPSAIMIEKYAAAADVDATAIPPDSLGTEDNVRGLVFAALVSEATQNTSVVMMTRTHGVVIYPDSISLKIIRTVPDVLAPYFIDNPGGIQ